MASLAIAVPLSLAILVMVAAVPRRLSRSAADDGGFEEFDCYRDLCVSKDQFCSDREQRCKQCLPVHCANRAHTPDNCRPFCRELLTTTTATTTTTIPTTRGSRTPPPKSTSDIFTHTDGGRAEQENTNQPNGIFIPTELLLVTTITFAVLLILVLALFFIYVRKLSRRLPVMGNRGSSPLPVKVGQELSSSAERENLLGSGWPRDSKLTASSASQSTMSSGTALKLSPPESSTPTQETKATQTDVIQGSLLPPYTARPNSQLVWSSPSEGALPASGGGQGGDSLQHHKGFDYRLMADHNGHFGENRDGFPGVSGQHYQKGFGHLLTEDYSRQRRDSEEVACQPGRPSYMAETWERHGQMNAENTCVKSV